MDGGEANGHGASTGRKKRRKTSGWKHLGLLLWKSMLLRRRHWILTLCELVLPIGLFSVMLFIRLLPDSTFIPVHVNQTTPKAYTEEDMRRAVCRGMFMNDRCHLIPGYPGKVYYGPDTPFTRNMAQYLAGELGFPPENIQNVTSNEELDQLVELSYYARNNSYGNAIFNVGLFFTSVDDTSSLDPPQHLAYDLRLPGYWGTAGVYEFLQTAGPSYTSQYVFEGFTIIQSVVDRRYVSLVADNNSYTLDYKIAANPYPYPAYEDDYGLSFIYSNVLPTFLVLALVLLCPSLIKSVVHEKDTGVRELICLMGMNRWLVWLGWFLHAALVTLVVVSVMAIMLKVGLTNGSQEIPPILARTDGLYVWLLLLLYGLSAIAFCMAISTLFNRPTLAMTVGILVWFLSYSIPNNLMYYRYDELGLTPKLLSCLLPNMAVTWAFRVIQMFEGRTTGVYWSNLWEVGNPRDQLTPGLVLVMLGVDTLLYLALTWYIDQVNPGTYGVPQPWYFPFMASYWCGPRNHSNKSVGPSTSPDKQYFEDEPAGLQPGIVIKDLRKEFKALGRSTKVAVENVTLTCYEGQCTVLLGHNGAGKTTTMSVLTGVYDATGGYAEVNGCNIATHLKEAREELGLCPQHNMLFVDLTVFQHLLFFGRLKGLTGKEAAMEAREILDKLELTDKRDMFGSQLSGGMKRKLSLAISLMGGSKVVILDEPSSGLDPESRRWVWDVVQRERGRRTFLITTHHMEEADVLGDRVAIMAAGRVVCAGSTLFLKAKFGDGYMLTILLEDEGKLDAIKGQVREHLPAATLATVNSGEVTFKLPPDTLKFAPLLDAFTARREELGIKHVGLSLTTMERVFLRVGEMMDVGGALDDTPNTETPDTPGTPDTMERDLEAAHTSSTRLHHDTSTTHLHQDTNDKLSGCHLGLHRFKAFIIKRLIYSKRKWVLIITQALLPVAVSIVSLVVDNAIQFLTSKEPPLTLSLNLFPFTSSLVESQPGLEDLQQTYESLFQSPYRVANTTNMTASLLEDAARDLQLYRENSICSAAFGYTDDNDTLLTTWYQTIPRHVLGIGTSLIDNALLQLATGGANHSITTTNRPFPPDTTWQFRTDFSTSALVYSSVMPLALGFLSASFLVFPLQERETQAKQVQVMTGVPVWMLWASTFFFDLLAYLVTALLIFICFMAINPSDLFRPSQAAGTLFFLLLLYGWGSIPFSYAFSFPFKSAAASFAIITLVNIVAGQMLSLVVYVLDMTESPDAKTAGTVLHWISSLIPAYPVSVGFRHLVETSVRNGQCDRFDADLSKQLCDILFLTSPKNDYMACCPQCGRNDTVPCFEKSSYLGLDSPGVGGDLLTLFVDGLIYLVFLAIVEAGAMRVLKRCWYHCNGTARALRRATRPMQITPRDDDVLAEEALVNDLLRQSGQQRNSPTDTTDAAMLVSGLSKQFLGSLLPAVDAISFRLCRGECLGLLGVNGAGKTTTFRMLTGDEVPSGGDAVIEGISLTHRRNRFVQQIGYCPQFDAILGELTGVEMLLLMGRLRGVSDGPLRREVDELVHLVDLTECAKRPSSTYSGGNRRKLSTAMALVGSPPLVFLDEPTSGVDPASRRRVWKAVSRAVSRGQSVVLTSHSMEECEALCSRIIMMARGTLRCVGTTGHLKAKFGQGYSLLIKLRTHNLHPAGGHHNDRMYQAKLTVLKKTVIDNFPGATVTDEHKGMIAYRVPKSTSWGLLFSVMEALKAGKTLDESSVESISQDQPNHDISNQDQSNHNHSSHDQSNHSLSSHNESSHGLSIVEDYAASDTSLEQVFLAFAREASTTEEINTPTNPVNGQVFVVPTTIPTSDSGASSPSEVVAFENPGYTPGEPPEHKVPMGSQNGVSKF